MTERIQWDVHKHLLNENAELRQKLEKLEQDNQDLQIALTTTMEHGDFVEAQLYETNQQLQEEIIKRKQVESVLGMLVEIISRQKSDLEIMLQNITEHGDIVDLQWHEKVQQARELAMLDGLTQIPNRRKFDEYFEQQWSQLIRGNSPVSLILCDIDFFKQFNDTYGHLMGDTCLKAVAQVLSKSLKRSTDLAARYGGEEFAIILLHTPLVGALLIAQQIQQGIEQLPFQSGELQIPCPITVSMGVACTIPHPEQSPQSLIDEADRLLYLAKQRGRNQIVHEQMFD